MLCEGNIVSTKYAYEAVPKTLDPFDDEVYKQSEVPFFAVVTNVKPKIRNTYKSIVSLNRWIL